MVEKFTQSKKRTPTSNGKKQISCKCPICKNEFDISEVVEPIRQEAINEFMEKVMKYEEK